MEKRAKVGWSGVLTEATINLGKEGRGRRAIITRGLLPLSGGINRRFLHHRFHLIFPTRGNEAKRQ